MFSTLYFIQRRIKNLYFEIASNGLRVPSRESKTESGVPITCTFLYLSVTLKSHVASQTVFERSIVTNLRVVVLAGGADRAGKGNNIRGRSRETAVASSSEYDDDDDDDTRV